MKKTTWIRLERDQNTERIDSHLQQRQEGPRDDEGFWQQVQVYIRDHSEANFTHGLCPECLGKLYPEYFEERKKSAP